MRLIFSKASSLTSYVDIVIRKGIDGQVCGKWASRMAARTFRKKKQQPSRVLYNVIVDVNTHVDNRERARASD